MEIFERSDGYTIWRYRNSEGRSIYDWTKDAEDGTAVDPLCGGGFRRVKDARNEANAWARGSKASKIEK